MPAAFPLTVCADGAELPFALREQSSASAEVAKRVEEIAKHAEETGAATRKATRSPVTLNEVAGQMLQAVGRFRTRRHFLPARGVARAVHLRMLAKSGGDRCDPALEPPGLRR